MTILLTAGSMPRSCEIPCCPSMEIFFTDVVFQMDFTNFKGKVKMIQMIWITIYMQRCRHLSPGCHQEYVHTYQELIVCASSCSLQVLFSDTFPLRTPPESLDIRAASCITFADVTRSARHVIVTSQTTRAPNWRKDKGHKTGVIANINKSHSSLPVLEYLLKGKREPGQQPAVQLFITRSQISASILTYYYNNPKVLRS